MNAPRCRCDHLAGWHAPGGRCLVVRCDCAAFVDGREQRCALCGGKLSPRWDPGDPLLCAECGAGNRRLAAIEDRGPELAHDAHVEEQIALGRDIYAREWYDHE